ncbi:MAG TPA: hypothetical protein VF868_14255 [Bacteroidia bacterium]|jgi:hypothetical protein
MKRIFAFAAGTMIFGSLLFTSCAKEEEPEPETPVSADPRARFKGLWYISENSTQTGAATYNLNIQDSTNASFIQFAYLWGTHTKIRATFSGNNLTIPSQVVEGNSFSGSGVLTNSNQINLSYWVNQGGGSIDTVTATLTK